MSELTEHLQTSPKLITFTCITPLNENLKLAKIDLSITIKTSDTMKEQHRKK